MVQMLKGENFLVTSASDCFLIYIYTFFFFMLISDFVLLTLVKELNASKFPLMMFFWKYQRNIVVGELSTV